MFEGKKVIGVTPAGRKRYLEILVPHLLNQRPTLDKHVFWINTDNLNDILYILDVCSRYPDFFEAKPLPQDITYDDQNNNNSIHHFFVDCCDSDTLYVRFDDDICWLDKNAVLKMAEAISCSNCFIAYANIINNAVITYFHQQNKRFVFDQALVKKECLCAIGWANSEFSYKLHRDFLKAIKEGNVRDYYLPDISLNPPIRVSINCIMWKGEVFSEFDGKVLPAEEQFLSYMYPQSKGLSTMIVGSAMAVHYAFFPQREYLDHKTDILEQYRKLSPIPIVG